MRFAPDTPRTAETVRNTQLLGPGDVAKWLGVSSGWVRDHATRKEPRIRAVKVGKLLRFRPEDVEDFLRVSSEAVSR
jgi:excisionase family DNA binding protein